MRSSSVVINGQVGWSTMFARLIDFILTYLSSHQRKITAEEQRKQRKLRILYQSKESFRRKTLNRLFVVATDDDKNDNAKFQNSTVIQ